METLKKFFFPELDIHKSANPNLAVSLNISSTASIYSLIFKRLMKSWKIGKLTMSENNISMFIVNGSSIIIWKVIFLISDIDEHFKNCS